MFMHDPQPAATLSQRTSVAAEPQKSKRSAA
jgi:hypothetical protein